MSGESPEVLELLLADGLVDLFTCRWLDDEFEVVLPADRSAFLHEEVSWKTEDERILVWFATTDKDFDFHRKNRLGIAYELGLSRTVLGYLSVSLAVEPAITLRGERIAANQRTR